MAISSAGRALARTGALIALLLGSAFTASSVHAQGQGLAAVRPVLSNGFPAWFQDRQGLALEQRLTPPTTVVPIGVTDPCALTGTVRVNGVGIPFELLERQYETLLRERRLHVTRLRNSAQVKGLRREALEQLIRIELHWRQARAADSAAGDEQVDRAAAQVRARFPTE